MSTPFPPDGPDIYQVKLFEDSVVCFYDGEMRSAITSKEELMKSDLVEMRVADQKSSLEVLLESTISEQIEPVLSVPSFDAIEGFVKGTKMVTVGVSLLKQTSMSQMSSCSLPFETQRFSMYMVWHKRNHTDLAHRWLRSQIRSYAKAAIESSTHHANHQ
jgi:DNA-binding transcriptional LysR family regulator